MDTLGLTLVASTLCLLLLLGLLEGWVHRRFLSRFKARVHVNGTRGKSSVTRLIAAGLRAGGLRVCAKTTGTLPRLIHPDGVEEPIYRVGSPNVIEQVAVVRRAARLGADILVAECMALQPFLQWVSTASLIKPSHAVITNVRPDHLDVMGPSTMAVAWALAGSVPKGAVLFTAESHYAPILRRAAEDRRTELVSVIGGDSLVSDAELRKFGYIEHADNVALALQVCQRLGVPRAVALAGMQLARPDPGALTMERCRVHGRSLWFINGFAANDPESTGRVWELTIARTETPGKRVALVNCRADRAERSAQLGEVAPRWAEADAFVVCGGSTHFFTSAAQRAGLDLERVRVVEGSRVEALAATLAEEAGAHGVVVGLGNIGGVGLELLEYLRSHTEVAP